MVSGVYSWVRAFFFDSRARTWRVSRLLEAEQVLREPLVWRTPDRAAESLLGLLQNERGLDLLDYCLLGLLDQFLALHGNLEELPPGVEVPPARDRNPQVGALQQILDRSGSAWTIGFDEDGKFCLQRRVDDTAEEAGRREMEYSGSGAEHLRAAWHNVYGRNPDPSKAYSEAIRAVEAAAHLIVTPTDEKPTLGKMISAMRSKPEKWMTVIGEVKTVRKMMQTIWFSQTGRHGRGDEPKPLEVSQLQAEAAVQLAVTLVQMFRTEAIRTGGHLKSG